LIFLCDFLFFAAIQRPSFKIVYRIS
jgi:hypothetical protein